MSQIISTLAGFGNAAGNLDRPLLDLTGLSGTFDFSFEWTPQQNTGRAGPAGEPGPAFLEALKDELGLKLEPQTGPVVDVLIVDHVEEPSAN